LDAKIYPPPPLRHVSCALISKVSDFQLLAGSDKSYKVSCLTIYVSNYKLEASKDGYRGVPYLSSEGFDFFVMNMVHFGAFLLWDSKVENSQVSQNSIVGINGENGASPA
jgi:hypothetical protein